MFAVRNATMGLMCALSAGCFLDESPRTDATSTGVSSVSSEPNAGAGGARSGFKPREPGVTTGRASEMDAAVPAAEAGMEDASTPHSDASAMQMPPSDPKDAGKPQVAPIGPMRMDAASASPKPDATTPPPADAQVIMDAGAPRTPDAQVAEDAAIRTLPAPIHRYEFAGSGRVAEDSIGDADGELRPGSFLDGSGSVGSTQRSEDVGVELPVGLLADLTAFSIIGWLDVRTDECWQRLFDFTYVNQRGMGMGMGEPMTQVSGLFVTPFGCPDGVPTAGYVTEQTQYRVEATRKLLKSRDVMLGISYDSTTRMLQLIVDGVVQREARVPINLRELARSRAGLGRKYSADDTALNGSIHELRIYAQTLDADTLSELARRGPEQL